MILFIYKYIIPIYSVIMLGVLVYAITHGLIRLWRVKSRFFPWNVSSFTASSLESS